MPCFIVHLSGLFFKIEIIKMQNIIEIPLNKGRFALLLVGSIIFFIVSIWLFNLAENQEDYAPSLIKGIGMIGFVFSGFSGLIFMKKLFDKEAGLTINHQGIIENTNGLSVRLIEWKDITGFETRQIHGEKLILVMVKKPQKYIDKASNNAQKRLLRLNTKEYGTPISITANSLKMDFEELLNLLQSKQPKRKT